MVSQSCGRGDALAIGNLGMLYVRGDGVKADKIAGVALLSFVRHPRQFTRKSRQEEYHSNQGIERRNDHCGTETFGRTG